MPHSDVTLQRPTPPTAVTANRGRIVRELRDLIAALDRRVPQVHRMGELAIASAAATLRDEALKRIDELEGESMVDERSITTG